MLHLNGIPSDTAVNPFTHTTESNPYSAGMGVEWKRKTAWISHRSFLIPHFCSFTLSPVSIFCLCCARLAQKISSFFSILLEKLAFTFATIITFPITEISATLFNTFSLVYSRIYLPKHQMINMTIIDSLILTSQAHFSRDYYLKYFLFFFCSPFVMYIFLSPWNKPLSVVFHLFCEGGGWITEKNFVCTREFPQTNKQFRSIMTFDVYVFCAAFHFQICF